MEQKPNYIVTENPALVRLLATRHLNGISGKYVLGFVIYYLIEEWVPNLLSLVFPGVLPLESMLGSTAELVGQIPQIPVVYMVYMTLLGGALCLGRTLYVMTVLRNRQVEYGVLLEGMPFYFKATLIYLIQMILFGLGLGLFIVPGVYLFYTFSQALFIFADDPNLSVIDCLRKSRQMMRGNVFSMIKVDLMYVSLILFGYIPMIVVNYIEPVQVNTLLGMLTWLILRITVYAGLSNLYLGRATFYELMKCGGFRNFRFAGEKDFREAMKAQSGYPPANRRK
ncbi:MAG: hypothetical protein IJH91_09830 [Mogibacterium sp.]|nr:hypothetical protein [Mogibacterium sp.]